MSNSGADRLRNWRAETAVILGSGLDAVVPNTDADHIIPYREFAEMPRPSLPGHAARFTLGQLGERRVIFAHGRLHLYQGRTAKEVTAGVRVFAAAGVKQLIVTNAAGSANKDFAPGSWMMIRDHINLTGTTPLLGEPNFVDMGEAYSSQVRAQFHDAASSIGMALHEGVYAGLRGPEYETPAEVCMLRLLGADAIGMSTVLEVIQARALGMEVAGVSCLTNWAAGTGTGKLTHEEVLATAKCAAKAIVPLLRAAL